MSLSKSVIRNREYRKKHPDFNKEACRRWYQRHKKEHYESVTAYNAKIRALINTVKGSECGICHCNCDVNNRPILHELNGKKHSLNLYIYKKEFEENKLENYMRVCYRCHSMLHWVACILMERNEEQQDKIVELAEKVASNSH
jgi:hypothetical protein